MNRRIGLVIGLTKMASRFGCPSGPMRDGLSHLQMCLDVSTQPAAPVGAAVRKALNIKTLVTIRHACGTGGARNQRLVTDDGRIGQLETPKRVPDGPSATISPRSPRSPPDRPGPLPATESDRHSAMIAGC